MNPLRDADVIGYVNPDGSGRGNWTSNADTIPVHDHLAHSYADEVYRRPTYEWYRPSVGEQIAQAVGCAAHMVALLIVAFLLWALIFGAFALASNV